MNEVSSVFQGQAVFSIHVQPSRLSIRMSAEDLRWTDERALNDWLEDKARSLKLEFLLAHSDDGVIWGRFDPQDHFVLVLSSGQIAESPPLRLDRLQQLRVFGSDSEILVWRDWSRGEWCGRQVVDGEGDANNFYDELQVLWGTRRDGRQDSIAGVKPGFTALEEGQGLRHVVPIEVDPSLFLPEGYRPVRLKVRHYLKSDDDGSLSVRLSRLVNVLSVPWNNNERR